MDQPASTRFYVVTNSGSFGIWEAREEDLAELLRTHPGYLIVQSHESRQEAEAYIKSARGK
jgi:antibiotic biosynthesis monooxygenase (ABM) superfamily enzyme